MKFRVFLVMLAAFSSLALGELSIKVVTCPGNFEEEARRKNDEYVQHAQFEATQKAKGLVRYNSLWITPEMKISLEKKEQVEKATREKEYFYAVRAQQEKDAAAQRQNEKAAEDKRRFDELAQQARNREANGNKTTIDINQTIKRK